MNSMVPKNGYKLENNLANRMTLLYVKCMIESRHQSNHISPSEVPQGHQMAQPRTTDTLSPLCFPKAIFTKTFLVRLLCSIAFPECSVSRMLNFGFQRSLKISCPIVCEQLIGFPAGMFASLIYAHVAILQLGFPHLLPTSNFSSY